LSTAWPITTSSPCAIGNSRQCFHDTCFATPSSPHNPENCLENFEGDAFGCNYSGLQRISILPIVAFSSAVYFFPSSTAVCNVCRICSYLRTTSTPDSWPVDVSLFRRRQHHGRVWETFEDRAGIRSNSVAAPPATERVTSGTALAGRGSSRWTHVRTLGASSPVACISDRAR
jgi:hypothetical protein